MKKLAQGGSKFAIATLIVALFQASAQDKKAAAPAKPSEAPKTSASSEKLPSAKEVVDKFVKAMGGAEAYKKLSSQHAKGTIEMPAQQMKGDMEIWAAEPNKLLMKINLGAAGEITTGYDGKIAWMSNPFMGPMLLEGKQLSQIATQADFDHVLHNPEDYKTMEVVGGAMFEGEDCWKLRLVDKYDTETTEYFSKKTGLQKGFSGTQESPFGPITATTVVTDYKKYGDLTLPTKIVQKMSGMEQIMTMTTMDFNKVDAKVFELPAEIKALAAAPKGEQKQPEPKQPEKKQPEKKP